MHSALSAACVTLKGTVGPLDLAPPLLESICIVPAQGDGRGIPDSEATLRGYSWSSQEEASSHHLLPGLWQTLWPASLPSTDVRVTPRRHGSSGVSSGRLPPVPQALPEARYLLDDVGSLSPCSEPCTVLLPRIQPSLHSWARGECREQAPCLYSETRKYGMEHMSARNTYLFPASEGALLPPSEPGVSRKPQRASGPAAFPPLPSLSAEWLFPGPPETWLGTELFPLAAVGSGTTLPGRCLSAPLHLRLSWEPERSGGPPQNGRASIPEGGTGLGSVEAPPREPGVQQDGEHCSQVTVPN